MTIGETQQLFSSSTANFFAIKNLYRGLDWQTLMFVLLVQVIRSVNINQHVSSYAANYLTVLEKLEVPQQ